MGLSVRGCKTAQISPRTPPGLLTNFLHEVRQHRTGLRVNISDASPPYHPYYLNRAESENEEVKGAEKEVGCTKPISATTRHAPEANTFWE
jgi:hypothetical protein